ncbi:MAG: hypothetical protein IH626_20805 [Rhodospirillales bacterium]|nr:hypothetical protein [Rhodospirillales bacterium]
MRALFPFGWLFLFAALLGAAAETAARLGPHGGGFLLAAYDVWYALWPGTLVVTKIRLETLVGPWAWDPLMTTVLALPLWALFGIPGGLMLWLGRPRRGQPDAAQQHEEDALFLYDSLAEQAEAEEREFAAFQEQLTVEVKASELSAMVGQDDAVARAQASARKMTEGKDDASVDDFLAERHRDVERE